MKINIFALFLVCSSINSFDDTQDDFRKHYGLSYYEACKEYSKIFKCLTACKSMGFKIFRMDRHCKCTCHIMKTTTDLPFFIWRTNGTTRKPPTTFRPSLYDIVGTLSPATYPAEENVTTEMYDDNSTQTTNDTDSGNATTSDGGNNTSVTESTDASSNDTATGGDGPETTVTEAAEESPAE